MSVPEAIQSAECLERTVEVQGIATHLFEAGNPAAHPLLYLHGMLDGNQWLDYHKAMARHFHVFVPDIPGFGLTARPNWMRDISDYVFYVRELLDALGLEKPFIVGHSIGGWIAAEIAAWYPERVGKLVLTGALGLRIKETSMPDIFAMSPEEIIGTSFANPMAALPLMPSEISVEYMFAQYKQLTTLASLLWNPGYDPKLARRLARVQCPTLLLWGEQDHLIAPAYGELYQTLIADSRLVKLAGAGHMPMFEQQEAWNMAVSQFLNQEGGNA